jgi:hypothetical protein
MKKRKEKIDFARSIFRKMKKRGAIEMDLLIKLGIASLVLIITFWIIKELLKPGYGAIGYIKNVFGGIF